ncbi:MAG: hypothetical protein HY736_13245 [Verrucomicrobia bacterium]|nr:hypothetical protein [Verrucomicrobiota bacterium]
MNTARLAAGISGGCAAMAVAVAGYQIHEARTAAAELASANEKRDAFVARVPEIENMIRLAERRAAEAEKDSGELLKAVASVRAQQEALASASRARGAAPGTTTVPGVDVQPGEAENQRLAQGRVEYQQAVVGGRAGTVAVLSGPGGQRSEEEKERLAQERAYQQDMATKRAAEVKARAELDGAVSKLDAQARFNTLMAAAGRYAASAEFQIGIRTYNQAMAAKPADLPVPDWVRELQATLRAQNSPVDVTLNSDGDTWVSIRNCRGPSKFQTTTMKILPGNYEVIGRRSGFRDALVMIYVRTGVPPPVVSVACTQPVQE